MRGSQQDVIGFTIQKASPADGPENIFITRNNHLGLVDVACGDNKHAILSTRRTVPFMVTSQGQGPRVRLQNQEEQVFEYGGMAKIPAAGIWSFLTGKGGEE